VFEAIQNNPWQTRHKYADISMSSVLPNILNKYFASIGHKLGTNTSQPDSHFTDYLKDTQIRDSFFCTPITSSEVESEILSIPNKKSHGLYSCPTKILKCARSFTSKPIAEMINISIQSGIYPWSGMHVELYNFHTSASTRVPQPSLAPLSRESIGASFGTTIYRSWNLGRCVAACAVCRYLHVK
jgi:hypothetical protein